MQNQVGYMFFFPKEKEMGFLKAGRRDRLLLNLCPMHGYLDLSKVKVEHFRNSGGTFLTQASSVWGKLLHMSMKVTHVFGVGFYLHL